MVIVKTFVDNTKGVDIEEYAWDFGDGSGWITTTSKQISHTYDKAGTYNIGHKVKVQGCTSYSDPVYKTVEITETPGPVEFSMPMLLVAGLLIAMLFMRKR